MKKRILIILLMVFILMSTPYLYASGNDGTAFATFAEPESIKYTSPGAMKNYAIVAIGKPPMRDAIETTFEIEGVIADDITMPMIDQYYDNRYDLNKDGVVDLNDLTFALQYILATENDATWEYAKEVDFTNDGRIRIDDLVLIIFNYTIPYYL